MADVLGILLVTSTSRGRNVFRYPPDPSSPSIRLSQPTYSHATYTTQHINSAPTPRSNQLFPDAWDGRKNSSASQPSSHRRSRSGRLGVSATTSGVSRAYASSSDAGSGRGDAPLLRGSAVVEESGWVERDDGSDSSAELSDDEDEVRAMPFSGKRVEEEVIKAKAVAEGVVLIDRKSKASKEKEKGKDKDKDGDKHDPSLEQQYSVALGYTLDALSDMLTPPRSACNRRFELNADALVFIGHPVSIDADGKWRFPEEEVERRHSDDRGRRREPTGQSHLRTVVESSEGAPTPDGEPADPLLGPGPYDDTTNSEDKYPTLNMFHVVVLVDKPDPKVPSLGTEGVTPADRYDEIYREIAFKWTAAAYDLQVRDNFIARESWEMARMREQFMNEGLSIVQCAAYMYHHNPLERALQDLALSLHKYRHTTVNPLYAHLSTTLSVSLAGSVISMTLAPRFDALEESWARWDNALEADDESSVSSDSDDGHVDDLRIEPWHTLLLIDPDTRVRAREMAMAVVGGGSWARGLGMDGSSGSEAADTSRRGSQVEEDEVNLMTALILACDVTKSLEDIAHVLRYDLAGIAIPLAKLLVQNKLAIPVHVMNHRLRTLVMPTTNFENDHLEEDSSAFARAFPNLPSLPAFLAQLTSRISPFRDVIPADVGNDPVSRQVYLDSLIWLLRHDLVTQVHARVRIFARPEVKEIAWRRLWQRRRERWLASRAASVRSAPSIANTHDDDDLITPRADRRDPIDSASPSRTPSRASGSATPAWLNQSYMDYDPELELDSDAGEGEGREDDKLEQMNFSAERSEPLKSEIPPFEASFIFRPARAVKDEMRWLRVIREVADEVWASKFDLCVQYFDGEATYEEISSRTGLMMREIDWIVRLFKEDVVVLMHP